MKQSDKVYEMNHQRSICAFQEYHRFEQEQNQNDTIEEHIKKDNKSHSFKHLHSTATCFDSYNSLCFKLIDKANSKFGLKIKEALHINWRKSNLMHKKIIQLSPFHYSFCSPCSFLSLFIFLLLFFAILIHLLFSLSVR